MWNSRVRRRSVKRARISRECLKAASVWKWWNKKVCSRASSAFKSRQAWYDIRSTIRSTRRVDDEVFTLDGPLKVVTQAPRNWCGQRGSVGSEVGKAEDSWAVAPGHVEAEAECRWQCASLTSCYVTQTLLLARSAGTQAHCSTQRRQDEAEDFLNNLVKTLWMDGFPKSEPPLSIACCGVPDLYRPIGKFRATGRI